MTQQANYRSRIPAGNYILSYPHKKGWKLPDTEINPLQPKEKKWEVKCGTELKKKLREIRRKQSIWRWQKDHQLGSQAYPARPSDIPHGALIDYRL